jgi:putative acetyltransferase
MSPKAASVESAWRVRPRSEKDWPALLDLWVASWSATYGDIDFDARRDWIVAHVEELEATGAESLLLTDSSGKLAGFVLVHPATGWLDQICVRPDLFGAGAARALIEAAHGVSPRLLRLDVNVDNARARAFYERRGFLCVGEGTVSKSGRKTVLLEWRES